MEKIYFTTDGAFYSCQWKRYILTAEAKKKGFGVNQIPFAIFDFPSPL
jgi:hypothetical protein